MNHNGHIPRIVSYDIQKWDHFTKVTSKRCYCEFCLKDFTSFDNMNLHFKKFHKSPFRRCLSNYYDLATFITDPKFQEMWHNVEQNTMGLEQFQHLLDSEKKASQERASQKEKTRLPKVDKKSNNNRHMSRLNNATNVDSPKHQKYFHLGIILERFEDMDATNSFGKIKPKQQRVLTNSECLEELSSRQVANLVVDSNGDIQDKWYSPKPLIPYQFKNFV